MKIVFLDAHTMNPGRPELGSSAAEAKSSSAPKTTDVTVDLLVCACSWIRLSKKPRGQVWP